MRIKDKVYVDKSKYHGNGIFANKDFKKGEVVFIMKGKILKYHPKNKKECMLYPNAVGIERDTWIDPIEPFVYTNHSCDPNMATKGKVTFVAIKNIKKGDELNFDYSISEDSLWDMKCNCKTKKCRKIIKSIRHLPEKTFNYYLPYIPTYFKKLYKKHKKGII